MELLPIGPFVDVASWIDGDDLDGGRMHRKAERRIAGLSDRAVIHERSSRGESPEPVRTTGHGISKIVAPIPHERKRTTSRRLSGVQGSHLVVASVYRDADIPPTRRNVDVPIGIAGVDSAADVAATGSSRPVSTSGASLPQPTSMAKKASPALASFVRPIRFGFMILASRVSPVERVTGMP